MSSLYDQARDVAAVAAARDADRRAEALGLGDQLTDYEWSLIRASVASSLRYAQRNCDTAKTDEAVERWAVWCTRYRTILDKLGS